MKASKNAYGMFGKVSVDTVVPTDLERVKKVRDLLRRRFDMSLGQVNELVAALYGFRIYPDIRDAFHQAPTSFAYSFSLEDEHLEQIEYSIRLLSQSEVLAGRTGVSFDDAEAVIFTLRPTSGNVAPSMPARAGRRPFGRG